MKKGSFLGLALSCGVAAILCTGVAFAVAQSGSNETPTTPLVWGSNSSGQLGYANPTTGWTPDSVLGLGPGSGVTAVSGGGIGSSFALKSDGTVLAWGANQVGQLGDGTLEGRLVPSQVSGLGPGSGVVAVSGGGSHCLALKSDGTVLAWGNNGQGQLGDGTTIVRTTPIPVIGLGPGSAVIAIAAGGTHSLALKSDGTVLAWGNNANGQIGDGTLLRTTIPVPVFGLGPGSGVSAIAGGATHSLAVKSLGTVLTWGNNANGQLGDGTTTQRTTPTMVSGLGAGSGAIAVAGGGGFSLALKSDGTVVAWGANGTGQLGDGTVTQRPTPVQVDGLGAGSGIVAVVTRLGASHSLALRSNGTVLSWGDNGAGQLGDGTIIQRLTPVQVIEPSVGFLTGVATVSIGASHTLALRSDGTVLAWGSNSSGQLGDGSFLGQMTPMLFNGLRGTVGIAAGGAHGLALRVDGSVWAWGNNATGQLGDGTVTGKFAPVQVSGLGAGSGVVRLAGGGSHSLALLFDGTVLAWGANGNGQLGDGTITRKTTPVQVSGLGAGSGVVAIAAAGSHCLALKSDGTVLAWGANANGQLGNGTITRQLTPVVVTGLGPGSGVATIAAGGAHSLALKFDGTVLAWGINASGQLGDGTIIQRTTPVQVSGLAAGSGVVAITAGNGQNLALKSDGQVLGWGLNIAGQVGDGTTTIRLMPVQVVESGSIPLSGVSAIFAGGTHSLAMKSDGTILAWGSNDAGQMGNGTLAGSLTPAPVIGLGPGSNVAALTAGSNFSMVLFPLTISGLAEIVDGLTTEPHIKGGLLGKLHDAQKAFERDNARVAGNKLRDFINQVEAQRGKALTDSQADLLVAFADALIQLI